MRRRLLLLAAATLAGGCARRQAPAEARSFGEPLRQVYRYGDLAEPQDLDPQVVQGTPEFNLATAFFEGLLAPDPKDLHPIPGLASSWEVSPDGLVYTFHLRAGLRWSDGTPITADDALQSWKRMLSPNLASEYAYLIYNYVKGAKDFQQGRTTDFSTVGFRAPDERTVEVSLEHPTPFLTKIIANHYAWDILPIHTVLKFGALDQRSTHWTRPGNFVCSGPFKLKEWTPDVRIVAVRNPNYWDAARVKLDEIDFLPIGDADTEERMFRADEIDATGEVPLSKIATYERDHPDLIHIDPYLGVYFYRCNVTRPPLNDKRVRKALAIAIDREALVRDVVRAGRRPAYAVSYPDDSGYTPKARISGTIEDAKRLLAEAGYPGGRGMPSIELLYNSEASNRIVAEAIQEMWRKRLGVEITLRNEEWKVYMESQHAHNYQMERGGWIADYPDPHVFLEIFETGNGNNDTLWSNAEYDRLLHAALAAKTEAERYADYQKMDAILVDECPVIPIYYYTYPYLKKTRVKGFTPNVMMNPDFKEIFIQQ